MRPIRRALLSVHNKDGIVELARTLAEHNVEILATGGTARLLEESSVKVRQVSDETGAPEMLGGRVKTLHPQIHGAILALRDEPSHIQDMQAHGIQPIDLVAVNLYPFEEVVAKGAWLGEALENIDIGGPTMLRAAAKNFPFVVVLTHPSEYAGVIEEIRSSDGQVGAKTRERLAARAFRLVARYDAAIAHYLSAHVGEELPESFVLAGTKLQYFRYGENPHQKAAFYSIQPAGLAAATKLQGKELSYNNLLDLDAALSCVSEFEEPAVVVVKHNNPCGVATDNTLAAAFERARATDPVSSFGGVVALNGELDGPTATAIGGMFLEAVIAPSVSVEAREILAKKKNLRVLALGEAARPRTQIRQVAGGFVAQSPDDIAFGPEEPRVVTKRQPTETEWQALRFAWKVTKHVKSNAIVFTTATGTVGVGAGQMSRVDSAKLAATKAVLPLEGTVVGSDAFFPFRDGIDAIKEAGATAVVQPGGSIRDDEVIAAADEHNLAMIFTGVRHFKH